MMDIGIAILILGIVVIGAIVLIIAFSANGE